MRLTTLLPALLLLALPLAARADHNPDFDDDAKPILRLQPGLLEYVETHFEVKDTGAARYPGDDGRRPRPPFMFRAKPRGEPGPYHLMLLIQPGPVNHILNVVDLNHVHLDPSTQAAPATTTIPLPPAPPPTTPRTPAEPAAAGAPTSNTPTGPIQPAPNPQQPPASAPSLEPPPDPAPATP